MVFGKNPVGFLMVLNNKNNVKLGGTK